MVFFGALLCILLAFFAVERKIAAYPPHSISTTTIVATGVQKQEQVAFSEPQNLTAPLQFVSILCVFAALLPQRAWHKLELQNEAAFSIWAPTHLAVRPPPAL